MIRRPPRSPLFPSTPLFRSSVTAPALILLPAWIANEVLQHFFSGQSAGYMAHLGGLLTGATLMALHLRRKPRAALAGCHSAPDDGFDAHVANARRLGQALDMEGALRAWRAAAQLRPADTEVLRAWFAAARYAPASEEDRKSTRLNSSHLVISYAVFCLK